MTDYKTTLKSNIQNVSLNKKKVDINCYNNKAGNLVISTLSQNSSIFGGKDYEIKKGATSKDFNVKFDSKEDAEAFKDTIQSILDDNTVPVEEPEKSGIDTLKEKAGDILKRASDTFIGPADAPEAPAGTPEAPAGTAAPTAADMPESEDTGNKKLLIIGGAVVLALVALVIWKARK